MTSARNYLRSHAQAAVIGGLVFGTVVFGVLDPGGAVPAPVYALGLVGGAAIALHAIGIVLVYRANRVINFAQIQMGVTAGLLFVRLVGHRTFIRGVAAICPACVPQPHTLGDLARLGGGPIAGLLKDPIFAASFGPTTSLKDAGLLEYIPRGFERELAVYTAPGWLVHLNYLLSLIVAVGVAALLLWAVYALIIRRFAKAPKLVLTVITLAAGVFVQQISGPLLNALVPGTGAGFAPAGAGSARLASSFTMTWSPVVFSAGDIMTVVFVFAAAAALALFLSRSRLGTVLRGAAENPDRAETLGVNVGAVTARAWILAGVLSGTAAVLTVARTGAAPTTGGLDVFVRTMAAAVAGGLLLLPLAVAASFAIGTADQVFAHIFGSQAPLAAVLLVFTVLLLLAQRARSGRAEREAGASWHASRELRPIPRQLRGVPAVRFGLRALTAMTAIIALGYPWFMSPSQTNLGIVTMVYAMVGLSLLVLTGWAGQISLGQMAFAALGAWVAAVLRWPFALSLVVGSLAGMVLAVIVGIPSLKLRGLHLAISTLALGLATSAILFDPSILGSSLPSELSRPMMLGINFESERAFYYLTLAILAIAVVATMGLRRSAVARALIASKDNEQAAMSFGIGLLRARVVAFAISGFMAAGAGVVLAYAQHGVEPLAFAPDTSVSAFLMTLIGGLGSVAGPLVGALYIGGLRTFSGSAFGNLLQILLNPGIGVILLFLVMPGGVIQGLYMIRDAWLRRVASRNRIVVPSLMADRGEADYVAPIRSKLRPSGGEAFVPRRFRLDGQWLVTARRSAAERSRADG